jgi:hypothetical protein
MRNHLVVCFCIDFLRSGTGFECGGETRNSHSQGLAFGFGQLREARNVALRPDQEMTQIVGLPLLVGMMRADEVVFIYNSTQGKGQILGCDTKRTSLHAVSPVSWCDLLDADGKALIIAILSYER